MPFSLANASHLRWAKLPDLVTLTSRFELRTNPFCAQVTTDSENWLLGGHGATQRPIIDVDDPAILKSMKFGLLATLCFPACDAPQLRLLADFLSLLFFSNAKVFYEDPSSVSLWSKQVTQEGKRREENGLDLLGKHSLFKHLIPRILPLSKRGSAQWNSNFSQSVRNYRAAQMQVTHNRLDGQISTYDEYMSMQKDLNGIKMVFGLAELLEVVVMPIVDDDEAERLKQLKERAMDFVTLSMDIFSFNRDRSRGNNHNAVALLKLNTNLSVQGAVHVASEKINEVFASFLDIEASIVNPPLRSQSYLGSLASMSFLWSGGQPETSNRENERSQEDKRIYIQRLKDYVVGTINWAYETELYFKKEGEDVRKFGWILLDPV